MPTSRLTPRRTEREVELVAICEDRRGRAGLHLAITISRPGCGMTRHLIPHGESRADLVAALKAAALWIEALPGS